MKKIVLWSELPEVLTITQTADYLQLSTNTVQKMFQNGELKAFRVGTNWRMDKIELLKIKYSDTNLVELSGDLRLASELLLNTHSELAMRLSIYADQIQIKGKEV